MKKYIKGFFDYRFLLSELVKRGIRLKYRKSYLGIVWSLIEPLMTTAVLVVVFGALFDRLKDQTFATYIMCGRLTYTFFQNGTKGASKAIRGNASMIKKVYVPKYLYPLSNVLYNFIIYLISLVVLVPVLIISHLAPSLRMWKLIPAIVMLLILTIGVGMILSVLDVFFPDRENREASSDVASSPESALLHHQSVPWRLDALQQFALGIWISVYFWTYLLCYRIHSYEEETGRVYFTSVIEVFICSQQLKCHTSE